MLHELRDHGHVIDPKVAKEKKDQLPGALTLDNEDEHVLLALRDQDPHRSLASYKYHLQVTTGTIASKTVLCKWFKHRFHIRGSLRKTLIIPRDKYKPANILRYTQYLEVMSQMDHKRLKFVDEKSLKGSEIFNRKGRVDPLTSILQKI